MKKSKRNSGDYGWSETWSIVNSDQVAGIQQMISAKSSWCEGRRSKCY